MFHLDINTLILIGVGAQLVGSVAKALFRKPAQQAQIDRIEASVSAVLAHVAPVLAALQSANVQTSSDSSSPVALAASSPPPKGPTQ